MSRRGFTLVELMVVIAIIGVLSSVLIPQVNGFIDKAKATKMMSVADTLTAACTAYNADVGRYNAHEYAAPYYTAAGDHELSYDNGQPNWGGPYIKAPLSKSENPFDDRVWMYEAANNWASATGGQGFDFNADGVVDTVAGEGNNVVFYNVPARIAQIVDRLVDGSDVANWEANGKGEYQGNYYYTFYLAGAR